LPECWTWMLHFRPESIKTPGYLTLFTWLMRCLINEITPQSLCHTQQKICLVNLRNTDFCWESGSCCAILCDSVCVIKCTTSIFILCAVFVKRVYVDDSAAHNSCKKYSETESTYNKVVYCFKSVFLLTVLEQVRSGNTGSVSRVSWRVARWQHGASPKGQRPITLRLVW